MRVPVSLFLWIVIASQAGAIPGVQEAQEAPPPPSPAAGGAGAGEATEGADTPDARARAMVQRWQTVLSDAETAARSGKPDALELHYAAIGQLRAEMDCHVATGHEELMARALRAHALIRVLALEEPRPSDSGYLPFPPASGLLYARQLWPAVADGLEAFGSAGKDLAQQLREADQHAEELRKRALEAQTQSRKSFVPPRPQGSRDVRYPPAAEAAGLEAVVRIRYLVDEHGVPVAVDVLDREIPSSLLVAALDAAREARFEPAMARGRAVPAERIEVLRFELPR